MAHCNLPHTHSRVGKSARSASALSLSLSHGTRFEECVCSARLPDSRSVEIPVTTHEDISRCRYLIAVCAYKAQEQAGKFYESWRMENSSRHRRVQATCILRRLDQSPCEVQRRCTDTWLPTERIHVFRNWYGASDLQRRHDDCMLQGDNIMVIQPVSCCITEREEERRA